MALLFLLLAFFLTAQEKNVAVKIIAQPQQIYIEKGKSSQSLNFDFAVENLSGEALRLSKIEVSVFDGKNELVLRRFVDGNGSNPSILTIPNREFPAKSSQLIFNPFHAFEPDVELRKLRYNFSFESEDGKKQQDAEVEVAPIYYETKTNLILPLKGRIIVHDGHDFYAHHRRLDYLHPIARSIGVSSNFMRYSYDFCPVNERGEIYRGVEENNENYFGFGAPVYAAGDGQVVTVSDGMPDNRSFNQAELVARPMILSGNHVVIDHRNGEYSLFGHLKQGSIKVKVGETIKQGQLIAQVGASGPVSLPHLHYELRTGTGLKVEGLPSYFRKFRRILGSKMVEVGKGQVDTGDILESR